MSLDIAILAANGAPTLSAGLGVEAHVEVLAMAQKQGAIQVQKMSEYYEDVDFEDAEVPLLRLELEGLRSSLSSESVRAVDEVIRVLREAESKGVGVSAIAD